MSPTEHTYGTRWLNGMSLKLGALWKKSWTKIACDVQIFFSNQCTIVTQQNLFIVSNSLHHSIPVLFSAWGDNRNQSPCASDEAGAWKLGFSFICRPTLSSKDSWFHFFWPCMLFTTSTAEKEKLTPVLVCSHTLFDPTLPWMVAVAHFSRKSNQMTNASTWNPPRAIENLISGASACCLHSREDVCKNDCNEPAER